MRPLARSIPLLLALAFAAGCGTGFELPTETRRRVTPGNGTYERIDTWGGLDRIQDVLLTKNANASNEQLYLLFRTSGADTGAVLAYPLLTNTPFSYRYRGMIRPVAMCGNSTRLFVLDQGDTCLARTNPNTGRCDTLGNYLLPPSQKWSNRVSRLEYYWRVREYFPDGGDTVSTFTDTTMAWVQGIAMDDQERIYISGVQILVTVNPENPFYYYRRFVWRVHRYVRGGGDPNMPGCNWRRAPSYAVEEGSGLGTANDVRGLDWNPTGGGALIIADTGNARAQRRSDPPSGSDYLILDDESGALDTPVDVSSDLSGYVYVADAGHQAVGRYRSAGQGLAEFVQRVDIEPNKNTGEFLTNPVAVAADNDLVYVADAGRNQLAIFRRRK